MTATLTEVTHAPVAQAPAAARTRRSSATNLQHFTSPLVSEAARTEIDATLALFGAAPLRLTGATETVARKAIRVALRECGVDAADAREMAAEMVAAAR